MTQKLGTWFDRSRRRGHRRRRGRIGPEREGVLPALQGRRSTPGGPLRFRWDFNGDGICDRTTGTNPRTVYVIGDSVLMKLTVTDDESEYVVRQFRVVLE